MKVFMADASVEAPREEHPDFHFTRKYIGDHNSDITITLPDWVEQSITDKQTDLMLQMDIEGAEYEVIRSLDHEFLHRFRIIIIEFHRLDRIWSRKHFRNIEDTFDTLLETHRCVHNHPNNQGGIVWYGGIGTPRTTELTFVRKDRINTPQYAHTFPHPLDTDNLNFPHVSLPEAWYRKGSTH